MALLIFHTVAIIFSLAILVAVVTLAWRAIKDSRREQREQDAAIATLSDDAREALKFTGGPTLRKAIVRWEKKRR